MAVLTGKVEKVFPKDGRTVLLINGVEYHACDNVKKSIGNIGPGHYVEFSHKDGGMNFVKKIGATEAVSRMAPSGPQEGTMTAPTQKPSEKAKEEFGVSDKTDAKAESPSQAGTPPDTQRMIVRQSMMKVACDAWCCSNHEKKDYDVTLQEIIRGMKVLEEAVFRDQ